MGFMDEEWDDKDTHIAELEELVFAMRKRIRIMKRKMKLLELAVVQGEEIITLQQEALDRLEEQEENKPTFVPSMN